MRRRKPELCPECKKRLEALGCLGIALQPIRRNCRRQHAEALTHIVSEHRREIERFLVPPGGQRRQRAHALFRLVGVFRSRDPAQMRDGARQELLCEFLVADEGAKREHLVGPSIGEALLAAVARDFFTREIVAPKHGHADRKPDQNFACLIDTLERDRAPEDFLTQLGGFLRPAEIERRLCARCKHVDFFAPPAHRGNLLVGQLTVAEKSCHNVQTRAGRP